MANVDKGIINHIFANFGRAIQAYLRLCISRNAPFDRYVAGDDDTITHPAELGGSCFL